MIELRPLNEAAVGELFRWRNDPRIFQYCRQADYLDWNCHLEWYQRETSGKSGNKMYAVCLGHEAIGVAGLTGMDFLNRRAEFSLYIAPRAQGEGYGREALKRLVTRGFLLYGLKSIWGETFDFNPAAKMFEAIGFQKEGIRRQHYFRQGKFVDAILYSILKEEWEAHEAYEGERCLVQTPPLDT